MRKASVLDTLSPIVRTFLPKEAAKALAAGKTWERQPESAEECCAFVEWDGEVPRLIYYGFGLEVEAGKAYLTLWSCDRDGNWDREDGVEVGTPDQKIMDRDYSYEASRATWGRYYRYAARTGTDPLGEFNVPTTEKVKESWQVKFSSWLGQTKHGIMLQGARRNSRGPWLTGANLAKHVLEYLCCQKTPVGYYTSDFKTIEEFKKLIPVQRPISPTVAKFLCKIDKEVPVSPRKVKEEIRRRSRVALADFMKRNGSL